MAPDLRFRRSGATFVVAGAGFEPATSGTIWPLQPYFGMSLVSFGCLDLHGDRLAADLATLPVASGRLGLVRVVLDGFSMGNSMGGSNRETCPEEVSAPVVAGCLLLSRTVFDQFGVTCIASDLVVDTVAGEAHLRGMTSRARGRKTTLPTQRPTFGTKGPGDSPGPGPRCRGLLRTRQCGSGDSPEPATRCR